MEFLLQDLFLATASKSPHRHAVRCNQEFLSYGRLEFLSRKIADALMLAGVRAGDRVGIYANKMPVTVAAILGTLRAGAVYVPLDPFSPVTRLATICTGCSIRFMLCTVSMVENVAQFTRFRAKFDWVGIIDGDVGSDVDYACSAQSWSTIIRTESQARYHPRIESDPAYILHTSGSTGVPKGVTLSHRNGIAFAKWAAEEFQVSSTDRVLGHLPFHFDPSIFDIFSTLAVGATLVLVPDEIASFPYEVGKMLRNEEITVWYSVPSALRMFINHSGTTAGTITSLRLVIFAGEVLPVKSLLLLAELLPTASFCNCYGPTETNVCTCYWIRTPIDPDLAVIPIGSACAGAEVFAVAEDGRLVTSPGEEGELLVRGPTVMVMYWGDVIGTSQVLQPASTVVPEAFGYIYRTGDIVSLDSSGAYRFIGRRDQMVKSRGYRIELGEIELALEQHHDIHQAAVVAVSDSLMGTMLVAFVVAVDGKYLEKTTLHRFVTGLLPAYMIPQKIVIVESFPLTSTGKIDRHTLRQRVLDVGRE